MSSEILNLQKKVRIKDEGILSSPYLISLLLLVLCYYYISIYTSVLHYLAPTHINILEQIGYLSGLHFYIHFPSNITEKVTLKESSFMFYLARVISDVRIRSFWMSVFLATFSQGLVLFCYPNLSSVSFKYISFIVLSIISIYQYLSYRSFPFSDPEIITFKDHFYNKIGFSSHIRYNHTKQYLVNSVNINECFTESLVHENTFS